MNRIDISLQGTAPATKSGASAEIRSEGLDEGFQKLLKKLSGEPSKDKAVPHGEKEAHPAAERIQAGKPKDRPKTAPADHSKPSPDLPAAGLESEQPAVPGHTEEHSLPELAVNGATDDVKARALPDILSIRPVRNDSAGTPSPVWQTRTAAVGHDQKGAVRPNAESGTRNDTGRDPFAALTSLLAKEDIGSEPRIDLPDRKVDMPKMTVVSRETHFEPVVRPAPVQQIASAIASEITETAGTETTSRTLSDLEQFQPKTSEGPLRILHIRLQPNELGDVSVKMRLVGGSLEVHLEASRAETAELLMKDKDVLNRLLRASGYSPDVVTIQAVADGSPSQSTSNQGQNGASSQMPGMAQGGNAQSDARRQDGNTGMSQNDYEANETTHDDHTGAADGDLYL